MVSYEALMRELPAVDRILKEPEVEVVLGKIPRHLVLEAIREVIAGRRRQINFGQSDPTILSSIDFSAGALASEAVALAAEKASFNLEALINGTGVVLHTNLGRSPLPCAAVEALTNIAGSYCNLELNLKSGRRGSRQDLLEEVICDLTGAEAAAVVNNNAAAVYLVLHTLAAGREVVVSRGELVEIGGSFRIPEIMSLSGANLVEVGTTNKTYLRDYEAAINENTALLLKVHTSNYHLVGFTASVSSADLAGLAKRHNLVMVEDLGSGVLINPEKYHLPHEPKVQDSINQGADLVTFSGDKMLGGPQAGIIAGRSDLIHHVRTNQLARSLRIDKFTIAALEATLRLYYDEKKAVSEIPVWRMLTMDSLELKKKADRIATPLKAKFSNLSIEVISGFSKVGGGALPAAELPTHLVKITGNRDVLNAVQVSERLRLGNPPVILRVQQDGIMIDPRTVFEDQEESLVGAVVAALAI